MRLSEVMAYADIPPSMRPMLSEPDATGGMFGLGGFQAGGGGGGQGGGYSGGGGGGGGGGGHIVASQVEAVKASMLKALGQLRQMHQSLGTWGGGSGDFLFCQQWVSKVSCFGFVWARALLV